MDNGAVPNIISHALVEQLFTDADIETSENPRRRWIHLPKPYHACKSFPSFDDVTVYADFLVIQGPPFDIILGVDLLRSTNDSIDFRRQLVGVSIDGKKVRLPLEPAFLNPIGTPDSDDTDLRPTRMLSSKRNSLQMTTTSPRYLRQLCLSQVPTIAEQETPMKMMMHF